MKILLTFCVAFLSLSCIAASPTFSSFDATDFGTNSANIWIKSNKWATVQSLTGKLDQTGIATNVAMATHTLYTTNLVPNMAPVVVSGATEFSQVNQTYNVWYSNTVASVTRVVWTNAVNATLIEYRSDGDNGFANNMSIEATTNDFADTFYYSVNYLQAPYPSGQGESFNGDTAALVATPISTVTSFQYGDFTNLFFRTYSIANTNIVVDKWIGDDTNARRTNGIPFATLGAACNAGLISGDIINMVTATYTEAGSIKPPKGVIVNGNYSTISGALTIVDNNQIYNLTTSVQPHVNVTNANSLTVVENLRVINSTDYLLIDDLNGEFQLINPVNNGYWDSIILTKMRTNGVFKLINPQLTTMWGADTGVTWGMHGFLWTIGPGEGGKVQVYGGSISVLNSTNLVFTSSVGGRGNSCFLITDKGGSTTNFGNASLEIYGTAFYHGSTNASVITTGLSNTLSIPVSGYYIDNASTGNPQTPVRSLGVLSAGPFVSTVSGYGLKLKEGANSVMGTTNLTGGSVVIPTTNVTANSRIFLSRQEGGVLANVGNIGVTARTAGTSFTVTSVNVLDTETIVWIIVEPSP